MKLYFTGTHELRCSHIDWSNSRISTIFKLSGLRSKGSCLEPISTFCVGVWVGATYWAMIMAVTLLPTIKVCLCQESESRDSFIAQFKYNLTHNKYNTNRSDKDHWARIDMKFHDENRYVGDIVMLMTNSW